MARPYIWRLNNVNRLTWPSVGPLLEGHVKAALTAASSWRSPWAKRFSVRHGLASTRSNQDSNCSAARFPHHPCKGLRMGGQRREQRVGLLDLE